MPELERSKGGKDSKKVKRSKRSTRKRLVMPRVHNKTSPLRRRIHKGQVYDEYKARGDSPFLMPFDSTLCRLFAYMRACKLPAPRG